jgi:hypothetical protein
MTDFPADGTIHEVTITAGGVYEISAFGAQGGAGGNGVNTGGLGAAVTGDVYLATGTVLEIVTGVAGANATSGAGGGGGGGSFVFETNGSGGTGALIAAAGGGGGGGAFDPANNGGAVGGYGQIGVTGGAGGGPSHGLGGTSGMPGQPGNGGGGGYTGGAGAVFSFGAGGAITGTSFSGGGNVNSGAGSGGFGGGGGGGAGSYGGGGGGGGYGGGGGGSNETAGGGGGGGSYTADLTHVTALAGAHSGDGDVVITPLALAEDFTFTGMIQTETITQSGTYHITAIGAHGGNSTSGGGLGGYGAAVSGDIYLAAGAVLEIITGGAGHTITAVGAAGGGGSFVIETYDGTSAVNTLLAAAGGGGGGGAGGSFGSGGAGGNAGTGASGGGATPGASGIGMGGVAGKTAAGGAAATNGVAGQGGGPSGGGGGGFTGGIGSTSGPSVGTTAGAGSSTLTTMNSFAGGSANSSGFGGGGAGGNGPNGFGGGGGGGGYGGGDGGSGFGDGLGVGGGGGGGGSYYAGLTSGIGALETDGYYSATNGNGDVQITPLSLDIPCFAAGTRILAINGDVLVENIQLGDALVVIGPTGAATRKVVWTGRRAVDITRHPAPEMARPVRIRAGAIAAGIPERDLRVSPDHAIYLDGQLFTALSLVNGTSIYQETTCRHVTYHHIELETHDILLAEGLPCESFLDSGNRHMFSAVSGLIALYPTFTATSTTAACAPLVTEGPALETIRAALASRANHLTRAVA